MKIITATSNTDGTSTNNDNDNDNSTHHNFQKTGNEWELTTDNNDNNNCSLPRGRPQGLAAAQHPDLAAQRLSTVD